MPSIKLTIASVICSCWLWKWFDLQWWCPAVTWAMDHPSPHRKCKVLAAWGGDPISLRERRGKFFNLNYLAESLKEGSRSRRRNGMIQRQMSFIPQDPNFTRPSLIATCLVSDNQKHSFLVSSSLEASVKSRRGQDGSDPGRNRNRVLGAGGSPLQWQEFQLWEEPHVPQHQKSDRSGSWDNLLRPMADFVIESLEDVAHCAGRLHAPVCSGPSWFIPIFLA